MERELTKRVGAWLDDADSIREFCVSAGLNVPSIMRPIFGAMAATTPLLNSIAPFQTPAAKVSRPVKEASPQPSLKGVKFLVPEKPDYGQRPQEAFADWLPVPLLHASSANLILYILKENGGSAPSNMVSVKLPMLRPTTAASTVFMTLKKLEEEGRIHGDYKSWILNDEVRIAMAMDRMWCALDQLRSTDRAAIRREVIVEALRVNQGLSVALIADCLRACEWLKGLPLDANAIKADMRILDRDGLAKKEGTIWRLTSSQ